MDTMEIESQQPQQEQPTITNDTKLLRTILLVVNFTIMFFGNCGTPLFLRLYFLHGGQRKWLSSWIQTAGWPLIFLPLLLSYFNRRRSDRRLSLPTKPYFMNLPLFAACTVLGLLTGLDDFFYAFGTSYIPVSTSAILISTQLGFTALFAFFLVKQRFTPFSVNAVALLMLGAVILGMDSRKDRAKGETRKEYLAGFCMMLAAALLYGVVLPLVELTYAKAKQAVTYTLVMEMQLVMGFFATAFCTVGMIVNKDFQAIPREAKEFGLGEMTYYWCLVMSAVLSQFFFVGTVGAVYFGSALLAGVLMAAFIPLTEVLSVIVFREQFTGGKGVSLALSLWGFMSYFYGEYYKEGKKKKAIVGGENEALTI